MIDNPLLARFADVPALVAPSMRDRFEMALRSVMAHPRANELLTASAAADDDFWLSDDDWRADYRPYVVKDGILQIPVKGVLLHDFPWALGSWATGYIYIARALDRGLTDLNVKGIALICDSYGGEVAGCFELADKIYAARAAKPIRAFAHEYAYSAGYAVASSAQQIVMSRTGGAGSIGVVTMHLDVSRALSDAGYKITFIFAGKHKVDGNAYEPLSDAVKARWQKIIDADYAIFCAAVARNRAMDDAAVRATEAECFTAQEAIENGLADAIGPLDDAVAAFNTELSAADDQGDDDMSNANPAAAPAATTTANQAALDAARTEGHAAGRAEGVTEGTKQGAAAERARISAIVSSEEAKDRTELARHLAFETDMSADAAKALLAKASKEAATGTARAPNKLEQAMNNSNPKVGADVNDTDLTEDQQAEKLASNIVGAYTGKTAA